MGQEERARKSRRDATDRIVLTVVGAPLAAAVFFPVMGGRTRPTAATAAMLSAARENDVERLQKLLDAGHDPNRATQFGLTPLMVAAMGGSIAATRRLLAHGVDFRAENSEGQTALSLARAESHAEVAALLRKAGATK